MRRLHFGLIFAGLALLLLAEVILAAGSGFLEIPFGRVARILLAEASGAGPLSPAGPGDLAPVVIMEVRLPRILTAALVGGGLAIAGVVFQGILRNPLADPYTLGVSAGAAFGAALAMLANGTLLGEWSVPALAFAGAAATLLAVIFLAGLDGGFSSSNLILSGIIVSAILSAGVSLIKYLADEQVGIIIFWLMGSFASRGWTDVGLAGAAVGAGMALFVFFGRDLNLLALGRRTAGSLGVSPRRMTPVLLVGASLVAAVCVAVAGIIGFVGLLVPHMARWVIGPDHRQLIPVSLLAGACLMLGADTVTRAVLPQEIPVGVVTALIGGPAFCVIYRRRMKIGLK
jgi:iron complex transport system permease protein